MARRLSDAEKVLQVINEESNRTQSLINQKL
jgi:hypothetical protein